MKKVYWLALALTLVVFPGAFAQNPTPPLTQEEKAKAEIPLGLVHQPIVYGKAGDGFRQSMRVQGVITDVSFVPYSCGIVCWWGAAKIKLLKRIKGYKPKYVYVAVLCFMGEEEEYLNKVVDIRVSKLYKDEDTRHCSGIMSTINTNGVPFYRLQDKNKMRLEVIKEAKAQAGTNNR
jgi:hypothetical protein